MSASDTRILILPGLHDSGPRHWQTLWEQRLPDAHRVIQHDWDTPRCKDWVATLERAVLDAPSSVLVAHSLACSLVAYWAARTRLRTVRGALLVAPADTEAPGVPADVTGFAPMPVTRLPFASVVVASSNDPHVTLERARYFASAWGARFVDIGDAGHISDSVGEWPEGLALLDDLQATDARPSRSSRLRRPLST